MSFQDEDIISKRREARRAKEYTIENEVVVDSVSYAFARRSLFNESVSIVLPESLLPMSLGGAKIKFPSENRPQVILCNENGGVTVGFSLLDKKAIDLGDLKAKEITEQMKAAIKRVNPACVFYGFKNFELDHDIEISCFSFTSYAVDADMRNFYCVANLKEHLLIGNFGCEDEMGNAWQPLVEQMMKSIQYVQEMKEEI